MCAVWGSLGLLSLVLGLGGWRCDGVLFGEILRVALGEVGGEGVVGFRASEKGRKGGESSSSSSASERGLRGAFVVE